MAVSLGLVLSEGGIFRKGVVFAKYLQMNYDWKKG